MSLGRIIYSTRVTRGDGRRKFLDQDMALVDVALVVERSPKIPGTYERLRLAVSRNRPREIEHRNLCFGSSPDDPLPPEKKKHNIQSKRVLSPLHDEKARVAQM